MNNNEIRIIEDNDMGYDKYKKTSLFLDEYESSGEVGFANVIFLGAIVTFFTILLVVMIVKG